MESADYSPIQSPQYEELLEVVTHLVAKLNNNWPAEKQTEQDGAPDPCVVPEQVPLAESSLYSWASQYRSRHPVEVGAEAQEWRLHIEVVKQI